MRTTYPAESQIRALRRGMLIDRKMQMRSGTESGAAHVADTLAGFNAVANLDPYHVQVGVEGAIP